MKLHSTFFIVLCVIVGWTSPTDGKPRWDNGYPNFEQLFLDGDGRNQQYPRWDNEDPNIDELDFDDCPDNHPRCYGLDLNGRDSRCDTDRKFKFDCERTCQTCGCFDTDQDYCAEIPSGSTHYRAINYHCETNPSFKRDCPLTCNDCKLIGSGNYSGSFTSRLNELQKGIARETGKQVLKGDTDKATIKNMQTVLKAYKDNLKKERDMKKIYNFNACTDKQPDKCGEGTIDFYYRCDVEKGQKYCEKFCGICDPDGCEDNPNDLCGINSCKHEETKRYCRKTCGICQAIDEDAFWNLMERINGFQSGIDLLSNHLYMLSIQGSGGQSGSMG